MRFDHRESKPTFIGPKPDPFARTLSDLPAGSSATIVELQGGHDFIARLTTLGFRIGTTLIAFQNYGKGPMIVILDGAHLAVGRGEAQKILIEPV